MIFIEHQTFDNKYGALEIDSKIKFKFTNDKVIIKATCMYTYYVFYSCHIKNNNFFVHSREMCTFIL